MNHDIFKKTLDACAEYRNKLDDATNEVARLREALKPFLKIANGIPENWPEQCILRFDQRNDGSLYVNYYGVQEASDGITIKQWRDLAQSPEKTNEVERLQAETDRLYIVAQEASESAQRKSNEVARLSEFLNRAIQIAQQLERELAEKTNEVARLRELLAEFYNCEREDLQKRYAKLMSK